MLKSLRSKSVQARASLGMLAAAMLVVGDPARSATILNGGFEAPDAGPARAWYGFRPASVPGWQTTDSAIEIWANGYNGVRAFEGTQHAELNANASGTLFQDVSGVAAGQRLSFEFAHRARRGTDVLSFEILDLGSDNVFGGGNDTTLFSRQYAATTAAWEVNSSGGEPPIETLGNSLRFAYTSVSTGSGNPSIGNFLDGFSASFADPAPVPLPASLPLLLGGIGALTLFRRYR